MDSSSGQPSIRLVKPVIEAKLHAGLQTWADSDQDLPSLVERTNDRLHQLVTDGDLYEDVCYLTGIGMNTWSQDPATVYVAVIKFRRCSKNGE